jgi:hypothetical protein
MNSRCAGLSRENLIGGFFALAQAADALRFCRQG